MSFRDKYIKLETKTCMVMRCIGKNNGFCTKLYRSGVKFQTHCRHSFLYNLMLVH